MLEIESYGELTYPKECCGLLLGQISNDEKIIMQILPVENEREVSQQHNRFLISPRTMLVASASARSDV